SHGDGPDRVLSSSVCSCFLTDRCQAVCVIFPILISFFPDIICRLSRIFSVTLNYLHNVWQHHCKYHGSYYKQNNNRNNTSEPFVMKIHFQSSFPDLLFYMSLHSR